VPPQDVRGVDVKLQSPVEHDWQFPSHFLSQHTPSTQFPDVHCPPVEHLVPLSNVLAHAPLDVQYAPFPHNEAVQLSEHLPSVPHRLLKHGMVVTVVHAPEPLHTDAVVALPSLQFAELQTMESAGKAQSLPLAPSHCPLQSPVPRQAARVLMGSPLTVLHFPAEPTSLQDSHCPSHLVSQQTPSTQLPDVHCWPKEQPELLACVGRHAPVVSQ
jgi:hypothetical protein